MATKAVIWEYFTINTDDESKVMCNSCGKSLSRGGQNKKSWGHSGMKNHLSTHAIKYREFDSKRKEENLVKAAVVKSPKASTTQATLEQSFGN